MSAINPYQAPIANLELALQEEYSEVKFFSTKGRLGRIRYLTFSMGYMLIFYLFIFVLAAILGAAGMTGMMENPMVALVLMGISYALIIGFGITLSIRRAHDFNKSGWWSLLSLVPLVNLLFLFVPGTDGENAYGKKTPPNRGGVVAVVVGFFVVIAIIGILAAIAIPAYNDYVNRAAESAMVAPVE